MINIDLDFITDIYQNTMRVYGGVVTINPIFIILANKSFSIKWRMHESGKVPTLSFVNIYGSQAKMTSAPFTIISFELLSSI